MVHTDGGCGYSTSSHICKEVKSMHADRHCYCMMHSDMSNHKIHAAWLRQTAPSYLSLFSTATWEISMQPHYIQIIPNDPSGSTTQVLWQVSELSTIKTTRLINKGFRFAFCLLSDNLWIFNSQKMTEEVSERGNLKLSTLYESVDQFSPKIYFFSVTLHFCFYSSYFMYETLNGHSVIKWHLIFDLNLALQIKCYKAAELSLITGMW